MDIKEIQNLIKFVAKLMQVNSGQHFDSPVSTLILCEFQTLQSIINGNVGSGYLLVPQPVVYSFTIVRTSSTKYFNFIHEMPPIMFQWLLCLDESKYDYSTSRLHLPDHQS